MQGITEKFSPAIRGVTAEHAPHPRARLLMHFHWHSHAPAAETSQRSLATTGWLRRPSARLGLFHALRPVLRWHRPTAGRFAASLCGVEHHPRSKVGVLYLLNFGAGTVRE